MTAMRCCAVVPTYDNPETIGSVVDRIRAHLPDVIVVDDGSAEAGRAACARLARDPRATVIHQARNLGKGAAIKAGLAAAHAAGFTHAFQIDADGQHDLEEIPAFLAAAEASPESAIFGYPVYDESAPALRRFARKITCFWVDLEVGRGVILDAMVGFRIYPVEATLALQVPSNRMAFDVESAVRLVWAGVPAVNRPVGIRYLSAEEGGLSHFKPFRDNVHLSWMHGRLCTMASIRWCLERLRHPTMLWRS